jgi:hypothetical protein
LTAANNTTSATLLTALKSGLLSWWMSSNQRTFRGR